jgi:gamma-glutamylcyclotransferase
MQLEKATRAAKNANISGKGNGSQPKATAGAKVYYFAFGSNMNATRMDSRSVTYSRRTAATLKGYRLVFNKRAAAPGQGYANIVVGNNGSDEVQGVLYETDAAGLASLDAYEGVPHHYYRRRVVVETQAGRKFSAVVYIAQPNMCSTGLKPTREYLEHLLAGKPFLSAAYLARLSKTATLAKPFWTGAGTGWERGTGSLTRRTFPSSPSRIESQRFGSGFSDSSLLRQAKLPFGSDADTATYSHASCYADNHSEAEAEREWEIDTADSDSDAGWKQSLGGSTKVSVASSLSGRKVDPTQNQKKNVQFEALLVELMENLDYDYDYRLYVQELLFTEARKRGVSTRQLFSLALLRSLTEVAEGKLE